MAIWRFSALLPPYVRISVCSVARRKPAKSPRWSASYLSDDVPIPWRTGKTNSAAFWRPEESGLLTFLAYAVWVGLRFEDALPPTVDQPVRLMANDRRRKIHEVTSANGPVVDL
jgi:hypothetical protein